MSVGTMDRPGVPPGLQEGFFAIGRTGVVQRWLLSPACGGRMVFGASVPCIFARDHLRQVVIHCLGLISDLSPMVQGPGQVGNLDRLGEVVVHPGLQAAVPILLHGMCGYPRTAEETGLPVLAICRSIGAIAGLVRWRAGSRLTGNWGSASAHSLSASG